LFCVCTYLCALYILVSYTFFVFYIFSFAAAMFSCSFHQNFLLWGFPKTLFVTFYPELQVYTILFHLCFWASVVFESFRSEPSIRVIHGDKWKKLSKTFQIISETFEIISNHFRNISINCATRTLRSMIHQLDGLPSHHNEEAIPGLNWCSRVRGSQCFERIFQKVGDHLVGDLIATSLPLPDGS